MEPDAGRAAEKAKEHLVIAMIIMIMTIMFLVSVILVVMMVRLMMTTLLVSVVIEMRTIPTKNDSDAKFLKTYGSFCSKCKAYY